MSLTSWLDRAFFGRPSSPYRVEVSLGDVQFDARLTRSRRGDHALRVYRDGDRMFEVPIPDHWVDYLDDTRGGDYSR